MPQDYEKLYLEELQRRIKAENEAETARNETVERLNEFKVEMVRKIIDLTL